MLYFQFCIINSQHFKRNLRKDAYLKGIFILYTCIYTWTDGKIVCQIDAYEYLVDALQVRFVVSLHLKIAFDGSWRYVTLSIYRVQYQVDEQVYSS